MRRSTRRVCTLYMLFATLSITLAQRDSCRRYLLFAQEVSQLLPGGTKYYLARGATFTFDKMVVLLLSLSMTHGC